MLMETQSPHNQRSQGPKSALPHALSADDVLRMQKSTLDGLSQSEAVTRLEKFGPNTLPRQKTAGALGILWSQINNPLIWILIGSGALAILVDPDDLKNGLVILGVVTLNTLIGFIQELRASRAIQALSQMVPEDVQVCRGGQLRLIPSAQLVPGDLVQIASGDKVPADLRLIRAKSLRVDEAALTGESVPAEKNTTAVAAAAPLGDRTCMIYGGTFVTFGAGLGVVTSTGSETELGRINELMNEAVSLETPLTKDLKTVGKITTIGISILAVIILVIGTYRMMNHGNLDFWGAFRETLIFSIALAVGAIPEGLPAIVTIALAIGVQRIAARRAVIRKLPSVETLGSTTVICSDKTGTLTKNEMTVTKLCPADRAEYQVSGVGYDRAGRVSPANDAEELPDSVLRLLEAGVLCNDASISWSDERSALAGDPTEIALLVVGEKAGLRKDQLLRKAPRVDAIPFESENQFMATAHERNGKVQIILKGAPEAVLKRCVGLTDFDRGEIFRCVSRLASEGLRVLAFAECFDSKHNGELKLEHVLTGFTYLGLQAMIDPCRPEAIDAIRACHTAGIKVKMITGDHPETAEAIGRQLGLLAPGQSVITGVQLASMTNTELGGVAVQTNVFARVAPEHKLRLVKALQDQAEICAMTGDGVNDAPALKQANIGVAMGITGTSVSKEAADIVLTDDNFATIAAAVEEGRRVYDNLIKSLAFVLPTNLGLALILIYAVLFFPFREGNLLVPILPTQILWINLVGAVALALPLAFEAKERDVMQRPPRKTNAPLLSPFILFRTVAVAILMTAGSVALFHLEYNSSVASGIDPRFALSKAQTIAVTTVIFFQLFYMLNCRSLRESIFQIGLFTNKAIFVGILLIASLQAAFIYAPPFQTIFSTVALPMDDVLFAAFVGASILPVVAIEKYFQSKSSQRQARGSGLLSA